MATNDNDKQAFLDAYARHGRKNTACKEAGICPQTLRRWLKSDEQFAESFADAQQDVVEVLEKTAFMLAVDGVEEERFDKDGNLVGRKTSYATNVLLKLLEANDPDKYKTRTSSELSGPGGVPLEVSPELAAARMAAILEDVRNRVQGTLPEPDPFA